MVSNSGCRICDKLGDYISADNIEGENFPVEFKQLIVVPDTETDVFKCPICSTYYFYERKYDNDVYNLFDCSTLKRITAEQAESIKETVRKAHAYEKNEILKFKQKVKRKSGAATLKALPDDEKIIVEYLMNKGWKGESQQTISREVNISMEKLSQSLKKLQDKGIIVISINYPMTAGEHNFQEEIRDADPLPYTRICLKS